MNDHWILDCNSDNNWNWFQLLPSNLSAAIPRARKAHTFNNLWDSTFDTEFVLLYGGVNTEVTDEYLEDTWLGRYKYNDALNAPVPITFEWTQLNTSTNTPGKRAYHAAGTMGNGTGIFLFGGWDGESYLNDAWYFEATSDTWKSLTMVASDPSVQNFVKMAGVSDLSMTSLDKGQFFILGGETSGYHWLEFSYYLQVDLVLNTVVASRIVSNLNPPPRADAKIQSYGDGKILLFGGQFFNEKTFGDVSSFIFFHLYFFHLFSFIFLLVF